jgi:hypothetical protein
MDGMMSNDRGQARRDKPKVWLECPNCGENVNGKCACKRNKCCKCGKPVGNVMFTVCDECWDKEHSNSGKSPNARGEQPAPTTKK